MDSAQRRLTVENIMKILITGGAGFIGSHLSEQLLAQGNSVVVLDNLSTGSIENVKSLSDHPDFQFIHGSICDRQTVEKAVYGCDRIYHMAAAVGVRLIVERPINTLETNISGFGTVLRAAADMDIRVLLASSSEVYGRNNHIPMNEADDSVIGTTSKSRWSYACSKMMDEFLAFAYWKEKKLPITICRFFNIIGPRQTGEYGMVVPRFITQALKGEPLSVYGDGTQTRCFLNVHDLVQVLPVLLESDNTAGTIYNLGSDREISIKDLAQTVLSVTDSDSEIHTIPFEDVYGANFEDMERRVPDITRIHRQTGFTPTIGLEETLAEIAHSIKESGLC